MQRIILRNLARPSENNINRDIEWLSECFGFSARKDTEKLTSRILEEVLKQVSLRGDTSTEKLSENLALSVQRTNYHLRTLIDSGFLFRERRRIFVRQGSVKSAVEEMRRDANRIFDNLSRIAEEIDSKLGFRNRF